LVTTSEIGGVFPDHLGVVTSVTATVLLIRPELAETVSRSGASAALSDVLTDTVHTGVSVVALSSVTGGLVGEFVVPDNWGLTAFGTDGIVSIDELLLPVLRWTVSTATREVTTTGTIAGGGSENENVAWEC
jgi:hypothetical protein